MSARNEIGRLSPRVLEQKQMAWQTLNEVIEKTANRADPLYTEYANRSREAQLQLFKVPIEQANAKDGETKILAIYDHVDELYRQCCDIRAKLSMKYIRENSTVGMTGMNTREYFENVVLKSELGQDAHGKTALGWIDDITLGLAQNQEDIQNGDRKGLRKGFYKFEHGLLAVDFTKTWDAEQKIVKVREMNKGDKYPGLTELLDTMTHELDLIKQNDPAGPARQKLVELGENINRMRGSFDWRPLQLAGVAVAGMATTFGLGLSLGRTVIKGEEFKIDIATAGWGAGLLALACPWLFNTKTVNSMNVVNETNRRPYRELYSAQKIGTGEDARHIFLELQESGRNPAVKKLMKQSTVSMAQLGTVITDPLVLSTLGDPKRFDDTTRAEAFRFLCTRVSQKARDTIATIIRTGKISG